MATAIFHSLRGTKSALILVSANKFQMTKSPAYVPKDAVEGLKEGEEFQIPDGFKLQPMVDADGVVRMTTDGATLNTLVWN